MQNHEPIWFDKKEKKTNTPKFSVFVGTPCHSDVSIHYTQSVLELQKYLLNKKTNLILYGYDSFLFDVSNDDGINVVRKIKEILERNGHLTKSKMGINYSDMKDITKKLQEKYGHN